MEGNYIPDEEKLDFAEPPPQFKDEELYYDIGASYYVILDKLDKEESYEEHFHTKEVVYEDFAKESNKIHEELLEEASRDELVEGDYTDFDYEVVSMYVQFLNRYESYVENNIKETDNHFETDDFIYGESENSMMLKHIIKTFNELYGLDDQLEIIDEDFDLYEELGVEIE
ncbi:hypothetical protein [Natranaerobius thermophilus]|nr:hypothetical protein [Natranaerobius thermophilus]